MFRIGHGFDVHPFKQGRKLILGGVDFDCDPGLDGHSDADVVIHAVMDAILGALGEGDIGLHFPPSDMQYKNISSRKLLRTISSMLSESEYSICNIDTTVHAEKPKIAPRIMEMRVNIAEDLDCPPDRVNIKATTWEGLGYIGRCEGIAADAVVLLKRENSFNEEKSINAEKSISKKKHNLSSSGLSNLDEPVEKKVKTKGSITIYTDGAAKGNPGPAGAGAVITDSNGNVISEISMFLGNMTNNQAEYQALILALKEVASMRPEKLIIRSDSQLMVKQLMGEYKVKNLELFNLFSLVQQQLRMIASWYAEFIPRENNTHADRLANEAINDKS